MATGNNWEYDIKCRRCGKIERMWFSERTQIKKKIL